MSVHNPLASGEQSSPYVTHYVISPVNVAPLTIILNKVLRLILALPNGTVFFRLDSVVVVWTVLFRVFRLKLKIGKLAVSVLRAVQEKALG